MATLRVLIETDPERLLARATEGLFPLSPPSADAPWPTLPAWVVLRQGGLRDDLHGMAARAGVPGWFDPPVCLFGELPTRWSSTVERSPGDEERMAWLSGVVARRSAGIFDRGGSSDGWVPAIDRFLREVVSEGITPSALRQAQAAAPSRDPFAQRRDAALADIVDDWISLLSTRGLIDGRDRLRRVADEIARDAEAFSKRLGGRRDVRIVGLADLRGGWTSLLRALATTPALDVVTLCVSHALPLPADVPVEVVHATSRRIFADRLFAAVAETAATDDGQSTTARESAAREVEPITPRVTLIEAPDVARETEAIAIRVRALIDDGVPPARIAVVYRQARPGVERMADALQHVGVPVTARRRTALAHTGPARAVRALLHAQQLAWSRHAVLELAEHPLLSLGLDATVLDLAGRLHIMDSLDAWSAALDALHARCLARDAHSGAPAGVREGTTGSRGSPSLPDTATVAAARSAWSAWKPSAATLATPRTMSAWFAWLEEVLTSPAWGMDDALCTAPAGDAVAWRADVRAREAMIALAGAWQRALDGAGSPASTVDASSFAARLSLLLDADLITQPETGFGVQVSEALAAGWRAFDHVFVCGLSAGAFPQRVTTTSLIDDDERRGLIAAGLSIDPPDAWRFREQELFRILCAAPRATLTVSWPVMDIDGREVVRSTYVDEAVEHLLFARGETAEAALEADGTLVRLPPHVVLTAGYPLLPRQQTESVRAHALTAAEHESRRSRAPSPQNGAIEDTTLRTWIGEQFGESYVWSATQLEELAKCGWSWFASRLLRLAERSEAQDGIEASVQGTLLHDALDRFFRAARVRGGGAAVFLRDADREWAEPLLQRALDDAWEAQAADAWLGNPVLHDLVRAELASQLKDYLRFEIDFNEGSYSRHLTTGKKQIRTGAMHGEFRFSDASLTGDGVRFRLRGTIDRIDRGVDERVPNAEQYLAAIDYKRSAGAVPGHSDRAQAFADGVVLQVPLYAAVLRQQFPDATLARVEYRTLRSPKVLQQLHFVGVRDRAKETPTLEPHAAADTELQSALDAAGQRVRRVRAAEFPTNPTPSSGCSPYCPARDVCRIPGGPVSTERW